MSRPLPSIVAFSRAAVLSCLLAGLLAGCENWPLYAHVDEDGNLPDDDDATDPPGDPDPVSFDEDQLEDADSNPLDDLVPVPGAGVPSVTLIQGGMGSCGYDDLADWPAWPEHPVDTNGDGTADSMTAAIHGWYAAEVDVFQVAVATTGDLWVTLEWDNAPDGSANSPYLPGDETAPWTTESDLDFVVFTVDNGQLDAVVTDAGVSLAYPQQTGSGVRLGVGDSVGIAVGCHHGVPTDYLLSLRLSSP